MFVFMYVCDIHLTYLFARVALGTRVELIKALILNLENIANIDSINFSL